MKKLLFLFLFVFSIQTVVFHSELFANWFDKLYTYAGIYSQSWGVAGIGKSTSGWLTVKAETWVYLYTDETYVDDGHDIDPSLSSGENFYVFTERNDNQYHDSAECYVYTTFTYGSVSFQKSSYWSI